MAKRLFASLTIDMEIVDQGILYNAAVAQLMNDGYSYGDAEEYLHEEDGAIDYAQCVRTIFSGATSVQLACTSVQNTQCELSELDDND